MATSRTAGSCLRRLTNKHSSLAGSACLHTVPRRGLHSAAPPLYLDFLAPAWKAPPRQAQQYRPASKPHTRTLNTRRSISTSSPLHATAITNPRKDDDGNEMIIDITPRAAHRLCAIAEKDGNPELALRVSVESGGCHGFQYLMSLVNIGELDVGAEEGVTVFEDEGKGGDSDGGYRPKVVMDEPSLELLKGSSVDYSMELIGSQFKVTGIPGATSSCGCGTSFDVA